MLRRFIRKQAIAQLPEGYDVDTHFRPTYDPWDQRLCLVPDGDLFRALSDGSASVVTDTIETFTENGVRLASGGEVEADVVVTATGLNVVPFGSIDFTVDGDAVKLPSTMAYQALMLSAGSRTSSSPSATPTRHGRSRPTWSLDYVCRLLAHLDQHGFRVVWRRCPPRGRGAPDGLRARATSCGRCHLLPEQGDRAPWRLEQNYYVDVRTIRRGTIDDGVLRFPIVR